MLTLRKAELRDFEFYYNLKCEKSAIYWSGYKDKPNYEKMVEFWHNTIDNELGERHIYILCDIEKPVGYVQTLIDENGDFGLSMGIVENSRGRGYGQEILRMVMEIHTEAKAFFCYIREDNVASQKCFIKNGFVQTKESYEQIFDLDNRSFKMRKYVKNKTIAIIPARSGSKGLKDKNVKLLNGKPLVAYSIEAAKLSGIFDTVHVSTDSENYLRISSSYGADEPFLRDSQNASDSSSSWDTVREVLQKYKELNQEFKVCVLLQPTSPLRESDDIKNAYNQFIWSGAKSLTSVTEVDHPIQWCFKLDTTNSMKDYSRSPYKNSRRQELEKYYRENGAIYIVNTDDIIHEEFDFYSEECTAYVMDKYRSIDIDTQWDFAIAETFMRMEKK